VSVVCTIRYIALVWWLEGKDIGRKVKSLLFCQFEVSWDGTHVWVIFSADPGCLSRIRLFSSRTLDPNCLHPGSRIRIKGFKYFNPKKLKKWFLSSGKYDPGCSSRIRMLTFYPSRIQGSKRHRIPDPDPQHR
jgi:hypothetical protein